MGKKRIIQKTSEELLKETEAQEKQTEKVARKKGGKKAKAGPLGRGRVYIKSSYNNTLITITDNQGNVVAWSSAGSVGFKGPKKATPFAAAKVVETLMNEIRDLGIREVSIFVRGVGSGRDSAVRALVNQGLEISMIKDVTPIPHNGCRQKKPRRV